MMEKILFLIRKRHAQHLSEKFFLRERSAFMAPQWVSSEDWPLSPSLVGFQGSSKASK